MSDAKTLDRLSEIGASLADIVEALEGQKADPEVAAALAEIAEALQDRKVMDPAPIVGAIKEGAAANREALRGLAEALASSASRADAKVHRGPCEWIFEPEYHPNGAIKTIRARPMET